MPFTCSIVPAESVVPAFCLPSSCHASLYAEAIVFPTCGSTPLPVVTLPIGCLYLDLQQDPKCFELLSTDSALRGAALRSNLNRPAPTQSDAAIVGV